MMPGLMALMLLQAALNSFSEQLGAMKKKPGGERFQNNGSYGKVLTQVMGQRGGSGTGQCVQSLSAALPPPSTHLPSPSSHTQRAADWLCCYYRKN